LKYNLTIIKPLWPADNVLIVHLRGKIMHHFRAFLSITLIIGFALCSFGCATSKSQAYNTEFEQK